MKITRMGASQILGSPKDFLDPAKMGKKTLGLIPGNQVPSRTGIDKRPKFDILKIYHEYIIGIGEMELFVQFVKENW